MATDQSTLSPALPPSDAAPLRVLVVEDHQALREVTVEALNAYGYRTQGVDSAEAVSELPAGAHFEVVLVDLKLPGEDGLSLVARLRQTQPNIGIVILSASHADEERIAGYHSGADIYLAKPTAPAELCAVIDALARRLALRNAPARSEYRLELAASVLHAPGGSISLRRVEVDVLYALAVAPERFLERWQLLECLGKPVDLYGGAQLEVLLSRLRSRLRDLVAEGNPIRAERGKGYRLAIALQVH